MRCLVTGGAGFIGSHLTEYLLADGNEVIVLDDMSTGTLENLSAVIDHPHLSIVLGCVTDRALVGKAAKGCDEIYHLAACVGVKMIMDLPVRSMLKNTEGTAVMLETAANAGSRIFYASTSEVYGRCRSGEPLSEAGGDCYQWSQSVRWSYASSKAHGEFVARAFEQERGLDMRVGRLFNVSGPRQLSLYGMVIPRFVEQALADEPITVHGDGRQLRCFTYVGDVVRNIVSLMRTESARGEIVNIASGNTISIVELAYLVKKLLQSNSKIVHIRPEAVYGDGFDDELYPIPDLTKLRSLLGPASYVGLKEIILKTAAERERASSVVYQTAVSH
jgi:UDP-glucose 4-epimerase